MEIVNYSYDKCDKPIINMYNAKATEGRKIHLDALFESGLTGSIEKAAFLILFQNCGYTSNCHKTLEDPEILKLSDDIRKGICDINITVSKIARSRNYTMADWAKTKLRRIFDAVKNLLGTDSDEETWRFFEEHYAQRDLYCYHSAHPHLVLWENCCKNFLGVTYAPHQKQQFLDVRKAIELGKPIILTREHNGWFKYVPELKKHDKLLVCSSPRNVAISPNNLLKYGNQNTPENKSAAWDMLISAVKSFIHG